MSAIQIRKFLLRQPRPAVLRIKCGDDVTTMDIPAAPHWAEIAQSVDALAPDLIEMLDNKGKFLRAVKSDQLTEEVVEDIKANSKFAAGKAAFDGETERFKIYAAHLAEAHQFTSVAFETLAGIVNAVTGANASKDKFIDQLQHAYGKALQDNAELLVDTPEDFDPMSSMFQMMMAGAMQGNQDRRQQAPPPQRPPPAAAPPPQAPPRAPVRPNPRSNHKPNGRARA